MIERCRMIYSYIIKVLTSIYHNNPYSYIRCISVINKLKVNTAMYLSDVYT
jgi:hypothetical protein